MKGVILELQEPGRRPELDRATFLPGDGARLVVVDAAPPLRRFLLRGGERGIEDPSERTVLWLRVPEFANDPIRVLQIDRNVAGSPFTLAEGKLQIPLEQDSLLRSRTDLVFQGEGFPSVKLLLRLVDSRVAGVASIGALSTGIDGAGDGDEEPDWEIPNLWESTVKPLLNRMDALGEQIYQKMRVPPAAVRTIAFIVFVLLAVGYTRHQQGLAKSATAAGAEAEAAAERSQTASTGSAEDAASCRLELAQLRRDLLQPEQARRLVVAAVLDRTLARSVVTAAMPEDGETEAALLRAEHSRGELILRVEQLLVDVPSDPDTTAWIRERLEHAATFNGELPDHAILWHARPEQRTDAGLTVWGKAGGSIRGPWGLGERPLVLVASGDPDIGPDTDLADVRLQTEWSRETLRDGLLAVRTVLLARRLEGRIASPPEQVHLWTIALWHAWNELPPDEGQGGVEECVRLLLAGAVSDKAAEPGEAVLPSLVEMYDQEGWTVPLARSAACPWREDILVDGVGVALTTVAEAAAVREREE
jgi:hypothetical protein